MSSKTVTTTAIVREPRSAGQRFLQLGLAHRRPALDVALLGLVVELGLGAALGAGVRALAAAVAGGHVVDGGPAGGPGLAGTGAFLVDRPGGDLLGLRRRLAAPFDAGLDVLVLPFTLGVRLFANMFADEKIFTEITNLYPPFTQFLLPLLLTGLGVFVALVQTLVFTLLSMIYISEVTHAPHDHTHGGVHDEHTGEAIATAHV